MSKRKRTVTSTNGTGAKGKTANSARTKRKMIIFVCILLAISILAGAIIGIVSAVKNARANMYIDGFSIDKGVASYLASYYKAIYIASLRKELAEDKIEVYDTPEFWNSKANSENTYGYYLNEFVTSLVAQTVAASKLFDDYTRLSDSDKQTVESACLERLSFIAGGSVPEFNSQTAKYGFDYSDFKKGSEILFKSWAARIKIFGNSGEGMTNFPEYIEKYYGYYSRSVLLFVRTEKIIATDAEGNKLYGDDRNYLMKELSAEERAERQRRLSEIRAAVAGINEGKVAPERFFELWELYDEGLPENDSGSYYFMSDTAYTKNFKYPKIIEAINDIEVGECAEIPCDIGVCFAIKLDKEALGYGMKSNEAFFGDFYSLAAGELYSELTTEYTKRVEIRDKWNEINVIEIPYNTDYVAEF